MNIQIKLTRAENLARFNVPKNTVVTLDMETEYLPVVVASEVYENNGRTPMEAKKAQAVAARTYAAAHALAGTVIDDTANYQAFSFKEPSTIPNSAQAVRETAGQVLVCQSKMITAWYSNSNGGRTKRSDEAWSSYKPWTVAKDDLWDALGRAKWGECKASHCVGMSQIGAAYAAYDGKQYTDIIGFYYADTDIVAGYGGSGVVWAHGKEESMIKTNTGLVERAQEMLGQPYWYGTCIYPCTSSLLASKTKQYPTHYTDARMPRYKDDIAKGKTCADCVGLIKGYYWERDGKVAYDSSTDVNTSGMYNRATVKGPIHTLPEVPGLVVYKSGHVGVYEGGGMVIEAKGFASGVIRSKLKDTEWTHWLVCPFISYDGFEAQLQPEAFTGPYTALVTTSSTPLNIWSDTKKTKTLKQVPRGATLRVIGYGGQIGWFKVEKDSTQGYADGQYLKRIDEINEPDLPDDEEDEDSGVPYRAKLVNVKTGLNLRTSPQKIEGNTILFIPPGETVTVFEDNCGDGFARVRFQDTVGYCTRSYLMQLDEE